MPLPCILVHIPDPSTQRNAVGPNFNLPEPSISTSLTITTCQLSSHADRSLWGSNDGVPLVYTDIRFVMALLTGRMTMTCRCI